MWTRSRRALAAVTAGILVIAVMTLASLPAFATGSLTSLSAGTENPFTGTSGNPYDWRFTTATTSNLTRVQATVPSGTDCAAHYLALPNISGNYGSTPDSAANSITGDIDVRTLISVPDYSTVSGTLVAKYQTANQFSYRLYFTSGHMPELDWSSDGTQNNTADGGHTGYVGSSSQATISTAYDNTPLWVRATLTVNDTGGHPTERYYTSTDGSTWTQLGTDRVFTTTLGTSIFDGTSQIELGTDAGGTSSRLTEPGKMYDAQIYNGIGGTLVNSFDASKATVASPSSITASTGEMWTVHQAGTSSADLLSDIACDITASTPTGIPSGGTATVRLISDVAVYVFSSTSVTSGTASMLRLTGFTNTATPGSYTSTITTYDNTATPVAVDTGVASALIFYTPASNTTNTSSVALNNSTPSATGVTYTITASGVTVASIKCIKVNFGSAGDRTGITPVGMSVASATLDAGSTWPATPGSWSVSNDNVSGTVTLTNVGGATPASGSGRTIVLDGITNSSVQGTYFASVSTYTNSNCSTGPTDLVSAAFAIANGVSLTASVPPAFTFTVGNQASACNGELNFASGAGGATSVALGNLAAGANVSGGQALSITGNSGGGFSIYVRGTQGTQNLRSGIHNWADVSGSYASPAALGTGERFGYTYHDSTSSTSVTNPSAANFIALTNTNNAVMGSATSESGNGCVSFDAQAANTTPAASYAATVIYTAVPTF